MLDQHDPIDFVLAENLGKTLEEIRALPNREILEWRAFLFYRSEMERIRAR